MNWQKRTVLYVPGKLGRVTASLGLAFLLIGEARAQSTFGGNAQHTANYSATAQNLNAVHWTTSVDLNDTGGYAHYGAPLITPANNIFVPVKTGATGGFEINVFNGASGAAIYSLSTDYIAPSSQWVVPYQPVLATNSAETRLYYPGAGGTVYYIDNVDSVSHGTPVQQVFYGTLAQYQGNASGFNSTVFIDTPITADSSGNIFFGFRVQGTAPAPLNTTQSGYARIDPYGTATYVLAGTAAADSNIGFDTHNAAPAVSNDQTTVYVVVKSATADSAYGYLLGLDAAALTTKYKVFLRDPRSNNANPAEILDISTASPMVGPDNDVYFGIYGNPANGSRGFLLHFSGDLTVEKAPGGFGWDYTPGIVPASMVPSYTGPSSYLLFAKYNNYAGAGNDSADGVNRIALLDPNTTEVDAHASSNGMLIMREVLTVIGPTADKENRSASLPNAVREWCINTPAVNPATNSIFVPSEDGHMYRWNLISNSLDEFVQLNAGIGDPYVPTVIGPDGQVYTTNGGTLSAMGSLGGVGIALTSSTPDVRSGVAGQSLTFSVAVTNTGNSGITPTGMVTITDTVYYVPSPNVLNSTTVTLASNLSLDANGRAAVATSALTADKHFITVSYSGDANFSAGNASLIQFVHASGTTTALVSSPNPSNAGQTVTFTATGAAAPPGSGTPTGQVTLQDQNNNVLAQAPLNGSGVVAFSTSGLALGSDSVTAVYASDSNFAASSGSTVQSVEYSTATTASSSPNPSTLGQSVTFTSTTTSGGGVPVGTVTFTEGATVWASNVTVNASGQASFNTTALGAGSHTITATFTGASGWANSNGNAAPQVVNGTATSTTTTATSSPNPSSFGQPVTFTSTTTSSGGVPVGTVTFTEGATVWASNVTVNASGRASFSTTALGAGSHTITATFTGASGWANSNGNAAPQVVNTSATTTAVSSSSNPSVYSQPVTLTATVTATAPGSGVPTGTVTFKSGGSTLGTGTLNGSGAATLTTSTLTVGAPSITAVYGGSSNFKASTSPVLSQTVNQDGTTTAVSSSSDPSVYSQPVTFTATVTATAPGSGVPAGTVTFKSGLSTLGTGTLNGSGIATLTTSTLAVGARSITAVYSGSGTPFKTSTSPVLTQTVNQDSTTTAVGSSSAPSVYGQPVTFTATVTATAPGAGVPTGTVTFKNGGTTLGTGTLNGSGTATFATSSLAVGAPSITAVYGGTASFKTSTSLVLTQTVNQDNTTSTVTSSRNPSKSNRSVTFTATVAASAPGTATPTGTVTFKDGATTLGNGSLSSGKATYTTSTLSTGTHQVTAVYGGSSSFLTSTAPVLVQTVN